MATTLAPTAQTTAGSSISVRQYVPWVVLAAVIVIGVGLLLAQRIGTSDVPSPVVKAAVADTVHGTSGHLVTADGIAIQAARVPSESELLVHGGPGSAVTVAGDRLR